jgi:hypothetical protein
MVCLRNVCVDILHKGDTEDNDDDDDDDDNNNNNDDDDNNNKIRRMWNTKTKVIPVIIGATGTISKSFRKYVSNIPENHEVNYRKQPYWALHTYFGKC